MNPQKKLAPAKAGTLYVRGGLPPPLSVSGFAFDANSTPQGEGFTLPPPKAAPPTEYRPSVKTGSETPGEQARNGHVEGLEAPIRPGEGRGALII